MVGLFYPQWSYWIRQSQSDKTVFALRRSPKERRRRLRKLLACCCCACWRMDGMEAGKGADYVIVLAAACRNPTFWNYYALGLGVGRFLRNRNSDSLVVLFRKWIDSFAGIAVHNSYSWVIWSPLIRMCCLWDLRRTRWVMYLIRLLLFLIILYYY